MIDSCDTLSDDDDDMMMAIAMIVASDTYDVDFYSDNDNNDMWPPYLHLATSEMWCWSGGSGILTELSLCYSTT